MQQAAPAGAAKFHAMETLLIMIGLLGAGAFWEGLYAPGQQLLVTALFAVLALRMVRSLALSWLEAGGLALLLLGAALSLVHPVAAGYAAHGPAVAAGWALALFAGRRAVGEEVAIQRFRRLWVLVAPLMVFGGIAAISYLPVHQSGRLPSFLGYPVAVGILGLVGLSAALPDLAAGRLWAPLAAFGSALGLWLSGSRGVWAAGVALALYLAWARPALLRRALWPVAAAFAAALWVGPEVPLRLVWPAMGATALACLTVSAVAWLQRRNRVAAVVAGVLAWAAAVALAPGWPWFLGRATALPLTEGSSVERMTFLRDGLAMAAQLPLGAGYKAWAALHLQGASYAYYSAEVHSAPLDLALAFGWLGAAGFVLLLGAFLWRLRQGRTWSDDRLAVLAGVAALALHALVDWDLSYGLFNAALWFGVGLSGAPRRSVRVGAAVPLGLASLALAASLLLGAGDLFSEAAQRSLATGDAATAALHAEAATGVTPWSDTAWAQAGQAATALGQYDRAVAALGRARALGPREPYYAELQAEALFRSRRWPEAAAAYRDLTRLWPWETRVYEAALERVTEMTQRAVLEGDMPVAQQLLAAGREILAALDAQKAKEPPNRPRKPIDVHTPAIERARAFFGQV